MKIVIINSLYSPDIIGGAEISTQILAETLAKEADVHVITVGRQKRAANVVTELINGVTVHRIPYSNLYWIGGGYKRKKPEKMVRRLIDIYNPLLISTMKKLIKEINPDLVHTQNLSGLGAAVWKTIYEEGIPIVHTLRDYSLISPVSSPISNQLLARLFKLTSLGFSKRVSAVIGLSSHILKRHIESGLFQKSEKFVFPNVVNGDIIQYDKDFTQTPLCVGYFGRVEEEKGIRELINGFLMLPSNVGGRLYVFGEGKLKGELSEKYQTDDRIVFAGQVKPQEVQKLMAKMDVTVVPSTWEEPFGRVIIESYQVGTPVYGSAIGGIPDVVLDREKFLFTPGSSEAIKEKLIEYYHLPVEEKEKIQKQCLNHCLRFTKQSLLERHLDLYETILQQAPEITSTHRFFSGVKR